MQSVAQFTGSIPRVYDEKLGPFLFEWSARRLGELVRAPDAGRVLEVSCGTGISTEGLRRALPVDVEIIATDLNGDMLAEANLRRGGWPNVAYCVSDAQDLPFPDASFDAVVCQFGIMFFEDKVRALREAVRVLRPGGQILFSVWDSLERNLPVRAVHDTIRTFFPEDPPRFLEVPFGLHDAALLRALFESAGATDVEVEPCDHVAELPSALDVAYGLVCGNPGVAEIRQRGTAAVEEIVDAAEATLAAEFGSSPFRASLRALFVLARTSGPADQPQ